MLFDKYLFTYLFLSFIFATIIDTLSHEWGHYIVAKTLGYEAVIHFGSTGILEESPEPKKSDGFWFALGGPLQTLMTGTMGLILMFVKRKSYTETNALSIWQLFLVFVTLFWLRPCANLATWLGGYFLNGNFSQRGDEIKLANYLHIPQGSILFATATLGLIILAVVIYKFVPQRQRLTFLTAGLTGGLAGYMLWFNLLGKAILP